MEKQDLDETITSNNDDDGESNMDDRSTEGNGTEEGENFTFTKTELEDRDKNIRHKQDGRWKDRLKKAGAGEEDGGEKKSVQKEDTSDERYQRLEMKVDGIKTKDQQDFVLDYAQTKNISVSEALDTRVVKVELKEMKETVAKTDALPTSSSRTVQARNSEDVGYWANQLSSKGKSAPTADMRKKVLARLAGK